jgi:AcrR family transcriptional regulator
MAIRQRDPARSRQAILDAGERLFAERGYEATSMAQIGEAAGLSRGAPGYFFKSKEALYRAVLDRLFDEFRTRLIRPRPLPEMADGRAVVEAAMSDLIDLLYAHPTFIALMEREVLNGGRRLARMPEHAALVRDGAALIGAVAAAAGFRELDRAQLLLSFMALAWFPIAHPPLVRDLGLDSRDPAFRAALKRHAASLLLDGALP